MEVGFPMIPTPTGWVVAISHSSPQKSITVEKVNSDSLIDKPDSIFRRPALFLIYQFWDHVQQSDLIAVIVDDRWDFYKLEIWNVSTHHRIFDPIYTPWFDPKMMKNYFHLPSIQSILFVTEFEVVPPGPQAQP